MMHVHEETNNKGRKGNQISSCAAQQHVRDMQKVH